MGITNLMHVRQDFADEDLKPYTPRCKNRSSHDIRADPAKVVIAAQGWGHKMAWSKMQKRGKGEAVKIYKLF